MTVPQVQDALRGTPGELGLQGEQGIPGESITGPRGLRGPTGDVGPEGPRGVQGIQGEPGEGTQAELDELAIRIDELGNMIAEIEEGGIGILQLTSNIVTLEETIVSLESDIDQIYDYIRDRIIGYDPLDLYSSLQVTPGEFMHVDPGTIGIVGVDPWDTLIALSSDVNDLRTHVYDLRSDLDNVIDNLADMKTLSNPDFDTGWVTITPGDFKVFYFDTSVIYDINNAFVYMEGKYSSGITIHQDFYGGYVDDSNYYGANWALYENALRIDRLPKDDVWTKIRVRIWQLP